MRTRTLGLTLAIAVLLTVGARGSDDADAERDSDQSSNSIASPPTLAAPATPAPLPVPEGYPQVVPVSSLPDQIRNWFEMSDHTEAVAIAPGVWAPLTPGATVESVVLGPVQEGFAPH